MCIINAGLISALTKKKVSPLVIYAQKMVVILVLQDLIRKKMKEKFLEIPQS
jgi:hypothetical protein